jgi:hypothetical protein
MKYLLTNEYSSFFDWFINERIRGTRQNQQECIDSAKCILDFLNKKINKIPHQHKWLYNKLTNDNNTSDFYLVDNTDLYKLLNEIIDINNSSSKKLFAKPYMKQGVEDTQLFYLKNKYGINSNRGGKSEIPITANGINSYRFTNDGEFKKGIKKTNKTSKSIDSLICIGNTKFWVTQKVTTDDGGATNSVNDDIIKFLKPNLLFLNNNLKNTDKFVYLLDGPYWIRKNRKSDKYNRIQLLQKEFKHKNIIICDSDNFGKLYGNK